MQCIVSSSPFFYRGRRGGQQPRVPFLSLFRCLSFLVLFAVVAPASWASVERGFVEAPKGICSRLLHKTTFSAQAFEPVSAKMFRDRLSYIMDQVFAQGESDPYLPHWKRVSSLNLPGWDSWPRIELERGPLTYRVIFRVVTLPEDEGTHSFANDSESGYGLEILAQVEHEHMGVKDLDRYSRGLFPLQNFRLHLWEPPTKPMERRLNSRVMQALMADSRPSEEQIQPLVTDLSETLQLLVARAEVELRERWASYLMAKFNSGYSPFLLDDLKISHVLGWDEEKDAAVPFIAWDIEFSGRDESILKSLNQWTQVKSRFPESKFRLLVLREEDLSGGPGLQLYLMPALRPWDVRVEESKILRLYFNSMDLATDVYLQGRGLNWSQSLDEGLSVMQLEDRWAESLSQAFLAFRALPPEPGRSDVALLLEELMWTLTGPGPNPWVERAQSLEWLILTR